MLSYPMVVLDCAMHLILSGIQSASTDHIARLGFSIQSTVKASASAGYAGDVCGCAATIFRTPVSALFSAIESKLRSLVSVQVIFQQRRVKDALQQTGRLLRRR